MGLLNNWLKKKDKEQLSKTGDKKSPVEVVAKKTVVQSEAPAKKTTKKKVVEHDHEHAEAEHKKPKAATKSTVAVAADSQSFKVLVRPLVTEKSAIAEGSGKYSFVVAKSASKDQIKSAVAEIYGVKPESVNVSNTQGRQVRFGRTMGRRSDYKKAIVTLPKGKTIDIHAGV